MKPSRFSPRAFVAAVSLAILPFTHAQVTGTALVRHAPSLNGTVEGSLHQMLPEGSTLNGGAVVTGDLLAPGTPTVRLNGNVTFGGTVDGTGAGVPSNYQLTLNGSARLGRVVRRTNPVQLPAVNAVLQPSGARVVAITNVAQGVGDFGTLRNLTLHGGVGQFAIPPGTYGDFVANGGSGFTLGVAGSSQPTVYNFQRLTLNGQTQVQVIGPIILNVAYEVAGNGSLGSSPHPSWLNVNVYSGGFTLNGGCTVHGFVTAPNGTIVVNGNSQLTGGVACDRLTVAGGGVLRLVGGTSLNRAPVANALALSISEDTTAHLTLTASDADGDALTFTQLTSPARGTLSGVAPTFTYTPAANFSGTDSFAFKTSDGQADSNVATVQITVLPVADRPTADSKSFTVAEDTPGSVILSGADLDGDALTFTVASQPAHGTLTTIGNNRVYTPAPNYHGADSFTYVANDGSFASAVATVSITITPVNDGPIAHSASYSVNEGQSVNLTLGGNDVDGNTLTFQQLSPPSNGTLTGMVPSLTYRPNANFGGTDSFTFRVFDGQVYSAPATISISVTDLNFAPLALAGSASTDEDTSTPIPLRATDQDGHSLGYSIVTPPQHGTLGAVFPAIGNAATVVYTPNPNFNGADTFTFRARDSEFADSNVAVISISVRPVNDAPLASNQSVQTDEDVAVAIVLTGSDLENGAIAYLVATPPVSGTLGSIVPGPNSTATVVYTPGANYNGPDSFTFKTHDGERDSQAATVSLVIRPVNDRPVAIAQAVTTNEDAALPITLTGTDVEGAALIFAVVAPPIHGTLSPTTVASTLSATLVYTPNANYHGADSFSFTAFDGERDSLPAVISVTVSPQNDAPVASGQSFVQPQDTPFNFTLAATDADGDTLSYTIVSPPARGVVSGTAPNLTYTPQLNDRSTVTLTFTASDGVALSNQATVSFTMVGSNNPPVAAAVPPLATDEDTALTISLSATDSDGDSLTFQIVTQPAHGALGAIVAGPGNTATVAYTPIANYHGGDTFTFKANDASRDSNIVTVSIIVRPLNDAPVAAATSATTFEDTPVTLVLTATDNDNDPLTYSVVAQPAHGQLAVNGANVVYTPQANFSGNDSFTWKARDPSLADSTVATVSIIVMPTNDAPVAASKSVQTDEDVAVPVFLTASDLDNAQLTFSVVAPPARGTLTGIAPNLTYKPATNDSGTYVFTYKANDGAADSAVATVTIVVRPINDPPVANPLTISTGSGSPTAVTLTGSDVDSAALTFAIATQPQHGTLTGTPPNVTYTSAANFGGFDSFTFTANDGALNSAPATIQITTGLPPRWRTYTTTADFSAGVLTAVSTAVPDELSNKTILAAYDVVWVANSSKGTVVKLEPETGRVVGEFLTTPDPNVAPYPSRIAVDSKGNAWVANMSHSSIVKIGLPENGGWTDRNGNGLIDSSNSLGDVRSWTGLDSTVGATDEAILLYVRTAASGVRHIAIDGDDNVWAAGAGGSWQKFDGRTGALLRTEPSIGQGENGGFLALNGRMHSAGNNFLIWDTTKAIASVPEDDGIRALTWASALDSKGNLWTTRDWTSTLVKYGPNGEMLGEYYHGEPWAMGIAIDANDHIWVAHSHCGHSVGHLLPDGTFLGNVEVANHGPVEVSIDRRGRIWVVSSTGVVERINALGGPLGADGVTPIGEVDIKSGNLGGALWTYGRFTGSSFGLASPDGFWTNVYDGTLAATTWGPVMWNGIICNDAQVEVEASLSADGITYGPVQTLTLSNRTPSGSGRYLRTRVRLISSTTGETPVFHDLTVGTAGYLPPATSPMWYVSAGEDIQGNWPDIIQLKGAFCRSLHPFSGQPTYAWTFVSGPGTVTFSNATLARPTAQFSAQGTYILQVTATLGTETSTDLVKVSLTPYNRAPYPNAGYTTFRADLPPQLWLWGSVRDDGLPIGATITSTWEKLFGPGTVTFANPNSAATTAGFSAPGVYVLRLRATDGELMGEDVTTVWLGFSCIPSAPEGLMAWWQAAGNGDDHIGGNQAFSERGADYAEGKIGGAFRFDGTNDRVRAFASPSLDTGLGGGFTVELWARSSSDRTATVFEYGQPTARGFSIRQLGRAVEVNFREANGTSHPLVIGEVLPPNGWTHVTATYDRATGEARVFINGSPRIVQTIGAFTLSTSSDVFIGGASNITEFFHGLIDEVSVYNRALYADEIAALVAHPAGKRPPVSNVPPVVNAGPDLAGKTANTSVALAGTVTDDGQPTNGVLVTRWSKVSGPGIVSFADETKPHTTATFSEGGVYVLKLLADDGGFCAEDLVEVRAGDLYRFDTDASVALWWTGNNSDFDAVRRQKLERFNGMTYGAGRASDGFVLDGANDYGSVAVSAATNLGSSTAGFTIELWAKPSRAQDVPLLMWTTGGTDGVSFRQWVGGVGLYAFVRDTAGNDHTIAVDNVFVANTWVHVALTYDQLTGRARLYRNGLLIKEQELGVFTPRTNLPLVVGALPRDGRYYQGVLDEITLFNRPLSMAEIQAIYQDGVMGKVPLDTNRPPIISAVSDLVPYSTSSAVTLNGLVTDDGLPSGNSVAKSWSKLEGPGTVSFVSGASGTTVATFSSPGTYVLRLDANDGLNQAAGHAVVVRVGNVDGVEPDGALDAWWPANGDIREVLHGNHDWEFLPRGPSFASGQVGQGFLFNGSDHYGRTAAHADLNVGSSPAGLTIEMWVKPSRAQDVPLVMWTTPAGHDGVSLRQWVNGVGLYAFLRDTAGFDHTIAMDGIFAANTWVHVAVTYDRATGFARLYRNSILIREQELGIFTPQTSYPLMLGALPREGRFFQGVLDEISFYTRPLSMADIQAIYEAGASGKAPLDDNQPPVLSAGPDLSSLNPTVAVALQGSVTDDGRPLGGTLSVEWTKVDGPGTVTFADPGVAATTAIFSAPGTYLLRLDASDGLNTAVGDTVVVRVGIIASVEPDVALAAWWPANGEVHEVARGGHDWEFLPRGATFAPGEVGQGYLFNGTDHYGRAAAHPDLDIGTAPAGLTIEMWVRPSRAQDVPLLMWTTPGGGDGVSFRQWVNGVGLYAFLRDTSGVDHTIAVDGIFVANTWVHVAVTYDRESGYARLFRNGVMVREQFMGSFVPQTTFPLVLGALPREGRYFQGILDEVCFYTRPLTLGQIQAIFQAGSSGKAPADDNQPPVVSAGPDVAVLDPNAVIPLVGSVVDDGRPFSGTLTTVWSKVEGPGTVTFANAAATSTTAIFGGPGAYVLRLDANDGMHAASPDTMTVRIGAPGTIEADGALAAWWPANGEVREVVRGDHDWEFVPRGPAFAAGKVGQGFIFNGTDHYGRTPAHTELDVGASAAGLTIELWVNPARAQDVPLVMWTTPAGGDGVSLRQWVGGVGLYAFLRDTAGVDHTIAVDGVFVTSVWTHVAVTYDRVTGFARLYRNSVLIREQELGVFIPQTTYPILLGALPREGRYYQGTLDEISLYTRPLSMAEIQAIYQSGVSGKAALDDNQAPVVTAGPDVSELNPGAVVELNGAVTDDARPVGGALTIRWSKVEGPGTVIFADAGAARTTATFSASGTYVLRLDADDAMHFAAPDTMEVRIGAMGTIEPDSALAAWWPANGEVHEVVSGNHDWEFLPRGASFGTGKVRQGFAYNGTDHYGRTPAHADLDIGTSNTGLTIEVWVNPSRAQDVPLVIWTTPAGAQGVSLRQWVNGVGLYAFLRDTSGVDHTIAVDGMFAANTWTHVAVSYDKTTGLARLYRNGLIVREQNLGIFTPQTSYPLLFGALPREGRYFQGTLDELSFYTRALDAAEIQAIFQVGANGKTPRVTNILPTVALVGPSSGGTLLANSPVNFTAMAVDTDGTIAKVEFFDGATKIGEVVSAQPAQPLAYNFSLNAGFATLGRHVITARAMDNAGGYATSGAVLLDAVPILPMVAITSPANNANFPASISQTLRATATYSAGSITLVEFFDGVNKLGETASPSSGSLYSIQVSSGFSAGSHMLTARTVAFDGASATSTPVFVTATTAGPTIALTSPTNQSTLAANVPFTLNADAADADGAVSKVEFFLGATKLGEDLASPYTFNVASGLSVGTHVLTAKATDNSGLTATSVPVSVSIVKYSGPPVVELISPVEDARLTQPSIITGVVAHASLVSWAAEYRLKTGDGVAPEAWISFATGNTLIGSPSAGNTPSIAGALGAFDPTALINGIYEIRLRMTDTGNTTHFTDPITVVVEGNMKVGAFTLAFEDLKVPVDGIPITITRTYDTRDLRVGDFGPGWRLALNNIRVQKNRNLGAEWWQTPQSGELEIQFFDVLPLRERIISVVFPDGETHRFRAGALVKNRVGDPDYSAFAVLVRRGKYRFYPIGDTTSKLEPLDANGQLADDFWIHGTGDQDLMNGDSADPDADVYNPKRFRLTAQDGTLYTLDERLGLIEIRDLNGNSLLLNRDGAQRVVGVTSTQNTSSGQVTQSVTIVRDASGRVDYIRDSTGKDLDYIYDPQDRLVSFANRETNITQFRYELAAQPDYLTRIIDPRGVTALRSEFDSTGKLIKQIDADGKETIFNRGIDSNGRFEKVKDRLGSETTFYYDARGNVTLKIDPLGAQTSYSFYPDSDRVKFETDHYGNVKSMAYDAQGNVTVQTIGARTSEDPATPTTGYTTRTTYNVLGEPTQITDPEGRMQTFSYDAATNRLLTHVIGAGDAAAATTRYTYHPDGSINVITDALGNTTRHEYNYSFSDARYPGAVKQSVVTVADPAGPLGSDSTNSSETILRVTQSFFDAQENQVAQLVVRTLPDGATEDIVTRYIYDGENRLRATVLPDGRVTETRYTSFGKEEKTLLWKSVTDYAAQNETNARITGYAYDSRGNQVTITHADGATEATQFDAENRKVWSQDRRGYRSFFTYDAVGRLRFTIHPDANDGVGSGAPVSAADSRLSDNPRTETVYDLVGRVTDAYDELRRRTQTVYFPDGTPDAGRRQQTVAVRSVGNLVTSYQYDKSGNVRFVTDPRGNTTETRYDNHGRPQLIVYPATDEHPSTQSETTYDALSRRIQVKDQEGKITRYRYDALGRLVEVRQYSDQTVAVSDADFTLSPSMSGVIVTRYGYDAAGNVQTQTDALGRVTTYWTDKLGRRTRRILPKDPAESVFLIENLQYDEWGNLWKRTDFAGQTTTFTYDPLNRVVSKSADPSHPSLSYSHAIGRVEFEYDPSGARRAARTFNANNVLLYTETTPHDERGRIDYKDTTGGRLDYGYYANNRLKDVVSSNPGGVNIGYRYDEVNRLESVDDASTGASRTTGYAYNASGSLQAITQPNAVVHTYGYDALNRLRALIVTHGTTLVHTYEYKLTPSGHRRQIVEGAKTTTYTYDDVYRLTGESIASDPRGNSGDIGYELDKVGNRLARNSQVGVVTSQSNQSYNSRDWRIGDTYTPNGSTMTGQLADVGYHGVDTYDFEERLIVRTKSDGLTVNISYDADGHRIGKNVLNAAAQAVSTTTWLVDTNNLTGYAQVFEERISTAGFPTSNVLRTYAYGTDLISQATAVNAQPFSLKYYAYDGHGSTRELTDSIGAVTDRYDYDAFGALIYSAGNTDNAYLYCGEQLDGDLGLYYLRARYLNAESGRFWSLDEYEGKNHDPVSLHKYVYADSNPGNKVDPTGRSSLLELQIVASLRAVLATVQGTVGIAISDQIIYGGNAGFASLATQSGLATAFIVGGRIIRYTWRFSESAMAIISRAYPGGVMALRGMSAQVGRLVNIFSEVSGRLPSNVQGNHLSVRAVFTRIPRGEGLAVSLAGSVAQIGSEHWRFHVSVDHWARNLIQSGRRPTVKEYFDQALPDALQNAGVDPFGALMLAAAAEKQALHYGYRPDEVLNWVFSSAAHR